MSRLSQGTLNLNAKALRARGKSCRTLRLPDNFNGVHRFRLHPLHPPSAGMSRLFPYRAVANAAVGAMIANMRCSTSRIPIQKETRPTVMMHRYGRARRRHRDFKNTHQGVLENNFVGVGRGLHGVVPVGKIRLALSVEVEVSGKQRGTSYDEDGDDALFSKREEALWMVHGAKYSDFLMVGKSIPWQGTRPDRLGEGVHIRGQLPSGDC